MNCNSCNAQLKDDALICDECYERVAEKAQIEKVNTLKANTKAILLKNFKSPLTLILAICMTVIAACFLITGAVGILNRDFIGGLYNLLIMICPILACIGLWKLWASKDSVSSANIKRIRSYPTLQKVLNIISMVFVEIAAALLLVVVIMLLAAAGSAGSEMGDISSALGDIPGGEQLAGALESLGSLIAMGPVALLIVLIIVVTVITTIMALLIGSFTKIGLYTNELCQANENGVYKISNLPPFIRLFIFGGFIGLGGLLSLSNIWSALSNIAFGTFLIIVAILFHSIHKEESENNEALIAAESALEEITRETNAYIARAEKERIEKQRAEDEAFKKELQQQMMQQMMFNNMMNAQNMQAAAQQAAPAAEETAPVAVATEEAAPEAKE